jgi:SAM-dependent methyltransferase
MKGATVQLRDVGVENDVNLHLVQDPAIAREYARLDYLTPCERLLVDTYVSPGAAVLDLGVGGGRTTPHLLARAGRYLGVDYSPEMIRLCRGKFPGVEFRQADASSMPLLNDKSFDVIFFSFNGIDWLWPSEKRHSCIRECWRLLRPGGVFIFSSHNPCSIVVWRGWDPGRLRSFSRRITRGSKILFPLAVAAVTAVKATLSFFRSASETISRIAHRLPRKAFRQREGYMVDPAHPGLLNHYWTPNHAISELCSLGFQSLGVWCDEFPRRRSIYRADWYYYAFAKAERNAEPDRPGSNRSEADESH